MEGSSEWGPGGKGGRAGGSEGQKRQERQGGEGGSLGSGGTRRCRTLVGGSQSGAALGAGSPKPQDRGTGGLRGGRSCPWVTPSRWGGAGGGPRGGATLVFPPHPVPGQRPQSPLRRPRPPAAPRRQPENAPFSPKGAVSRGPRSSPRLPAALPGPGAGDKEGKTRSWSSPGRCDTGVSAEGVGGGCPLPGFARGCAGRGPGSGSFSPCGFWGGLGGDWVWGFFYCDFLREVAGPRSWVLSAWKREIPTSHPRPPPIIRLPPQTPQRLRDPPAPLPWALEVPMAWQRLQAE